MLPSELGTEIGPGFRGVKALVVTGNNKVALLRWPFFLARKVRKSRVLARWIGPEYVRPVWGESPPPVCDAPKDEAARKAPLLTDANASPSTETEGVAQQIAIDANVLVACPDCSVVYRRADANPASAYKLANAGFSRKLYPDFPDRKALTDAVNAAIDAAPDACGCGAKPTQDAQKKPGLAQEQVPGRSVGTATKTPQQAKPSAPQSQSKHKERPPESDPFADIVSGVFADAIVPGGSVLTDLISAINPDGADAGGDLPIVPGIPTPDAGADDEIGTGREPEAGE